MNFRTTLILLLALVVLGGIFFYQQWRPGTASAPVTQPSPETPTLSGTALFTAQADDVNALTIQPSDGSRISLVRVGPVAWRFTAPVNAPARNDAINAMVTQLVGLRSQGQVNLEGTSGLNPPRYSIAMTAKDGHTMKFAVGDRTPLRNGAVCPA